MVNKKLLPYQSYRNSCNYLLFISVFFAVPYAVCFSATGLVVIEYELAGTQPVVVVGYFVGRRTTCLKQTCTIL